MRRYERLDAILELLARDGKLDVEGAAERLGASEATIRRDLEYLAEQGHSIGTLQSQPESCEGGRE